mmetsp:Transcript_16468/g.27959  ORF Transcript_16468/g.27959 Transcript_16468/m.27959 type:complete len:292 (+) Transcript_16468:171-1046(+)
MIKGEHLTLQAKVGILVVLAALHYTTLALIYAIVRWRRHELETSDQRKVACWIFSLLHSYMGVIAFFHLLTVACWVPGANFLTDPRCFEWTSPAMELFLLIPINYYAQDLIITPIVFGDTPLVRQTLFHHLVGVVGALGALVVRRMVGTIAVSLLFAECSTIFLMHRSIMLNLKLDKDPKYKKFYVGNGIVLVVTFFLTRVLFMGVLLLFYMVPLMFSFDYTLAIAQIGLWRIVLAYTLLILFGFLYVLNIFWFGKMFSGLLKFLKKSEEVGYYPDAKGKEEALIDKNEEA